VKSSKSFRPNAEFPPKIWSHGLIGGLISGAIFGLNGGLIYGLIVG
jgi:hypothetical protein